MRTLRFCLLGLLLSICFTSSIMATIYYVDSQNGSDANAGTSPEQAWQTLEKVNNADLKPGDQVTFVRGGLWRGTLRPKSGLADGGKIIYASYGNPKLPKPRFYGSKPLNKPTDWQQIEPGLWRTVEPASDPAPSAWLADVGNLIFDGKKAGVKRWSKEELKNDDDFWFELETRHVWLVCEKNPAAKYAEIEAALRRNHVVDLNGVHHVFISGLDVRYGDSHGFGGSGNSHIDIFHCDISWIGGGHQFTRPDGVPVRYGNGIEFWANAHSHTVVGCRLWEIYDAALTNQGDGTNKQRNISYLNNIIWNCEYSFEYWNRDETSVTDEIMFRGNTCRNAGGGWGHSQRPDPNGRHLMFYETTAKTTNFSVMENMFINATESILRVDSRRGQEQPAELSNAAQQNDEHGVAWVKELFMVNNIWVQQPDEGRMLVLWQSEKIDDFEQYRQKTDLDQDSVYHITEPNGTNEKNSRDYYNQ